MSIIEKINTSAKREQVISKAKVVEAIVFLIPS